MKQQEKGYAENSDYITQSAALQEVEMFHPTFNRYANMLGIRGIREGRCMFYKRSDIERLKSIKSNLLSRAVGIIERETGKKVKEIILED